MADVAASARFSQRERLARFQKKLSDDTFERCIAFGVNVAPQDTKNLVVQTNKKLAALGAASDSQAQREIGIVSAKREFCLVTEIDGMKEIVELGLRQPVDL